MFKSTKRILSELQTEVNKLKHDLNFLKKTTTVLDYELLSLDNGLVSLNRDIVKNNGYEFKEFLPNCNCELWVKKPRNKPEEAANDQNT